MKILIIDDSLDSQLLIKSILEDIGYTDLLIVGSAFDAFKHLCMDNSGSITTDIDLILMDIVMPEMDGIEACRLIKSFEALRDVPIIMVTAATEGKELQMAFAAGAMDYITKPLRRVEMMARVRSALKLKYETNCRKAHEQELLKIKQQLEKANEELKNLSNSDGLTGIANRRSFDYSLDLEWKRAQRKQISLSLIMIDIDFFKAYNDRYGHQSGDKCLKLVAITISDILNRAGDLAARYGGEEFVVFLPGTNAAGASSLAERMRDKVEALGIEHLNSSISERLTISLGVSTIIPDKDCSPAELIASADLALYQAKHEGRNRLKVRAINENPYRLVVNR